MTEHRFYAYCDEGTSNSTKTTLVAGTDVYWLPGDEISVYGSDEPFKATITEPSPYTDFVGNAPTRIDYYAMYPFSLVNNWESFPDVILKLPPIQTATKGSFANELNAAIGYAKAIDKSMKFKNIFGYIKFTVPDSLRNLVSVTVESINSEQISSYCRVTCTDEFPSARPNATASNSVQLVSDSLMEAGSYYIALIPGTYKSGLKFTFKNSEGKIAIKAISRTLTLAAGHIQNIGTIKGLVFEDFQSDPIPPDDEIWYITSDRSVAEPRTKDVFGATIISNIYENGKGIIKFDGPVTKIGEKAFWYCEKQDKLINVYLPESVTELGKFAFCGCSVLDHITIPSKVTKIGNAALASPMGGGVKTIINKSEKLTEIANGAFNSECLTEFRGVLASDDNKCLVQNRKMIAFAKGGLTQYSVPSGIDTIGKETFINCRELTKVVLPDGLRVIESQAFSECISMVEINIPESVTEIGDNAFLWCEALKEIRLPDKLMNLGSGAFSACYKLESVHLGNNIKTINNYTFSNCFELKTIKIPDTIESIGREAFKNCPKLKEFDCKFATPDKRAIIINNSLIAFAPYEMKEYMIPVGVTKVEASSFYGCSELQNISIPEGVTEIADYAFYECGLTSLVLPSTLRYVKPYMFSENDKLGEVYCLASKPPTAIGSWSSSTGIFPEDAIIRVPEGSVDAYKSAFIWNKYNILSFDEEIYTSSDYSQDGVVTTLQNASIGNGIDVVFMGDAYSDRQIANGDYDADINKAMELLFSEEPYRSFREYFNVYNVKAVSSTEGYGLGATAFSGYFGNGTAVGGNDTKVKSYALKAISSNRMDNAIIIVMMNREYYAGTCYMYYPTNTNIHGNGLSISYFPLGTDDDMLSGLILHEAGGHGFAKLADEYAYPSMGTIPDELVESYQKQQINWGWWKNVDFTGETSIIKWANFLSDSRYQYDGLGAFEGGFTYWSGVWRPTENSIMRENSNGFNAPSREAIYYRINKLAFGLSWNYDYEEFVNYDAINRSTSSFTSEDNYVEKVYEPTAPPVIIPHAWNEY